MVFAILLSSLQFGCGMGINQSSKGGLHIVLCLNCIQFIMQYQNLESKLRTKGIGTHARTHSLTYSLLPCPPPPEKRPRNHRDNGSQPLKSFLVDCSSDAGRPTGGAQPAQSIHATSRPTPGAPTANKASNREAAAATQMVIHPRPRPLTASFGRFVC